MGAKLDRIGADLEKARRKRAEWDARVKDLERRYREEENSEIHEMVHAANLTPDQLSEVMVLLIQFMTTVILQNVFFGFLSFLPFVAAIGGFEYAYQKKASSATEKTKNFRKKFYKISAWLGLYFPIRFIVSVAARFYPRPYNVLVLEVIILAIYIAAATCVNLSIDKSYLPKE